MSFLIIHEEEIQRLVLEDDTGDGKRAVVLYRRIPDHERDPLQIKFSRYTNDEDVAVYEPDMTKWPRSQRKLFMDAVIRTCVKGGQGFQVNVGGIIQDVDLTPDHVIAIPELAGQVATAILSAETKRFRGPDVPDTTEAMVGNSRATSGPSKRAHRT